MDDQTGRWQALLEMAAANRPKPVVAQEYLRRLEGASNPVVLRCNDGLVYVVKGSQAGRMVFNDHVVGQLGRKLGAPVAEVGIVDVPAELVEMETELRDLRVGPAHGSLLIPRCQDAETILPNASAENRPRFALLAILYGWAHAEDRQLLYGLEPPHLVHSVDHGHFFHGGASWTPETLLGKPNARPDPRFVKRRGLRPVEMRDASVRLAAITDEAIAEAVAAPPDEWGVSVEERVAMARYLAERRAQVLQWVVSHCRQ